MARTARRSDISDYVDFCRRILKAAARRAADADPTDLDELVGLRADLELAIAAAVYAVHESGATWQEIGDATGTSRQAAHQKWNGAPRAAARAQETLPRASRLPH